MPGERGGKSGKRAGYRKARKKTCLPMLNGTGSGKSRTEVFICKIYFSIRIDEIQSFFILGSVYSELKTKEVKFDCPEVGRPPRLTPACYFAWGSQGAFTKSSEREC